MKNTNENANAAIVDLKHAKQMRSWMQNMFNFLATSKKLNVKLIDTTAKNKKADDADYVENNIIQGIFKDRYEKEFTFQVHLDPERKKGETAQNQVYVSFQHKKDNCIKIDVDTNGQLYDVITQYVYSDKDEKMVIYSPEKVEKTETVK
jgi:hypothetical protein